MNSLVKKYHYGQYRNNYNGYLPAKVHYIDHLFGVREILSSVLFMFGECKDEQLKKDMCDAAIGHDLLEDTKVTEEEIIAASNPRVLALIKELTNPVDDAHTEQYMDQLSVASEEARLIKYADLIENTSSVCYNYHIVGEEWAHDFYRPIMYGTLRVLENTSFPTYPKTSEFMHNLLTVYINILNRKTIPYLKQYPVKVLQSMKEAIPDSELIAHMDKYRKGFIEACEEYNAGIRSDTELEEIISNQLYEGFQKYIDEKRLFDYFVEQSWKRFITEYHSWKKGETPNCAEGEAWLYYEDYKADAPAERINWSSRGEEASVLDKISFFRLMEFFHIPCEFFKPIPANVACPDILSIFGRSGLCLGLNIWKDDGGLTEDNDPVGKSFTLTDHHGLKTIITITKTKDLLSKEMKYLQCSCDNIPDYLATGIIEGYTTEDKREIEIYLDRDDNRRISFIKTFNYSLEDKNYYYRYPLWQEYFDKAKKDKIWNKVVQSLIVHYKESS